MVEENKCTRLSQTMLIHKTSLCHSYSQIKDNHCSVYQYLILDHTELQYEYYTTAKSAIFIFTTSLKIFRYATIYHLLGQKCITIIFLHCSRQEKLRGLTLSISRGSCLTSSYFNFNALRCDLFMLQYPTALHIEFQETFQNQKSRNNFICHFVCFDVNEFEGLVSRL